MDTNTKFSRRTIIVGAAAFGASAAISPVRAQEIPKEIKLDYAYYSAASLVLRRFNWMEEEFKPDGTTIKWVFSQGSNNSLEFINSGSSDFASTSGISALVARSNGFPIKMVYMLNTNEASALMVPKESTAKSLSDLKGMKIAATKGTDPFFFLLRALNANGMKRSDIEHVHLQHPEGLQAMLRGSVQGWAGLDPHMGAGEVNSGIRPLYRNAAFSSYVPLNTTENFINNHPKALERVLKTFEKARLWMIANPDETAKIMSEESKQTLSVIKQVLTRSDFTKPIPEAVHVDTVRATIPILVEEDIIKRGVDANAVLDTLVDTSIAKKVVKK